MKQALGIILHNDIQRIFDNFAASFGISIVFYSVTGKVLKRGLNRPPSPYCALIQNHLFGQRPCYDMDEKMCRECTRSRKPVSYRCHAGIEEAVAPLFVGNQLAGYAMIGQFRTTNKPAPKTLAAARKKGLEAELRDTFIRLPSFSREQTDNILGLFSTLADYIVTKEIVAIRGERIAGRILAYIEEHLHEPVSIRDAATATRRSISSVSHHLKQATGKTFTQHLNEARIRRAEKYLRQSPGISIREVAEKAGFNDPFYFSRVYKKLRGFPPVQTLRMGDHQSR